jgi:hypothetical protein
MPAVIPREPIALDDVLRLFPSLRQSLLSKFDDCPLSALLDLKYANGWSTHPQARGTVFHLYAAKVMQTLREEKSQTIPVQLAEQIMVEACRQETDHLGEPIDPRDIVRVPLRQMPELRMAARKFAKDNEFSSHRIIDIEKRLSAVVTYSHPDGGFVERELTGRIDALLYEEPVADQITGEVITPPGAIVIDWKDTWALPPEPKERDPGDYVGEDDELRGLSYHGYFQQRFYGWLVMKNYPSVQRVTLREFYARKTKARKATLTRDRLPEVEEELSILAQAFDFAIAQGEPAWPFGVTWEDGERILDIESMGRWKPQPGRHCGFCVGARQCPVDEDVRIEAGGAFTSWPRALKAAAELQVVERARKVLIDALKGFVETQGAPVPVKSSKGRRVVGWYETKRGRRFGLFTPDDSDRGGHADLDRQLAEAMREATARAQESRPKRERRRRLKPGKV